MRTTTRLLTFVCPQSPKLCRSMSSRHIRWKRTIGLSWSGQQLHTRDEWRAAPPTGGVVSRKRTQGRPVSRRSVWAALANLGYDQSPRTRFGVVSRSSPRGARQYETSRRLSPHPTKARRPTRPASTEGQNRHNSYPHKLHSKPSGRVSTTLRRRGFPRPVVLASAIRDD
jgi:hypothetical protein